MIGRPTSLTPETQAKFLEAIDKGLPRTTAAAYAGVHRTTYFRWMREAEQGAEPFATFATAVEKAEADHQERLIGIIAGHAADTPQAAQWLLERRYPVEWSQRVQAHTDKQLEAIFMLLKQQGRVDNTTLRALRDAVTGARQLGAVGGPGRVEPKSPSH